MRSDGSEAVNRGAHARPLRGGRAPVVAVLALATAACGGGASTPGTPGTPTPPSEVFSVAAFLYFDENRNNVPDGDEDIRLGDVEIEIAGRVGRSNGANGAIVVPGLPRAPPVIRSPPASLLPRAAPSPQVPSTTEIPLPVALPIGQNVPFRYLASGDSISQGTGSGDERGYASS
jgi:hypothetical protein